MDVMVPVSNGNHMRINHCVRKNNLNFDSDKRETNAITFDPVRPRQITPRSTIISMVQVIRQM